MSPPRVPHGLVADLLAVMHRHGYDWADGDNRRRARAIKAVADLITAVTLPAPLTGAEQDEVGW